MASLNTAQLIIVSGPSGVGKTSMVKAVLASLPLVLSISHTTRPCRPGEEDGKDYHFVNDQTFATMVAQACSKKAS